MWKVLQSWMNQYVDKFTDQFELITKEVLDYTEQSLSEQRSELNLGLEHQQKLLEVIQPRFQQLIQLRKEII